MQPGSLAYKIFIDRFALKDLTRTNLKVGDMVLVHTHPGSEIGTVLEILSEDQVKVELPNKVSVYHVDHVDKPVETAYEQCCRRVSQAIPTSNPERTYEDMVSHKFVPAGRILAGAGSGQEVTMANCYVVEAPHDSRVGIYSTLTKWSELLSRGGGVGANFSTLRPRGALVKGVNGRSSGAVSWMEMFSQAVKTIIQGGCMHKDSLVHTSRGIAKITEIRVGDSVMTENGYRKVTNVFNNGVKDLYSLTLSNGKNIKCTLEHKFLVLDKSTGKMYKKELGSVTSDDVLCYSIGGSECNSDYVELKGIDQPNRSTATIWEFPKYLTEDLAYFMGYFYGNGSCGNYDGHRRFNIAVPTKRPEVITRLKDIFVMMFGKELIEYPNKGNWVNLKLGSIHLYDWLKHNGLLKGQSSDLSFPVTILRSRNSVQLAYLAGYFDADGCDRGVKGGFGFDSVDLSFLQTVQTVLAYNGIYSKVAKGAKNQSHWQDTYRLVVTGGSNKQEFYAKFKDYSLKLTEDPGSKQDHTFSYPGSIILDLGIPTKYTAKIWCRSLPNISRAALKKVASRIPDCDTRKNTLTTLLKFAPVTISTLEYYSTEEVYDLEVDVTHTYVCDGVLVSNSRMGASMIMLNDWHPDLLEFISVKKDPNKLTGANISIGLSDDFMEAVQSEGMWTFRFPDTQHSQYDVEWDGDILGWEAKGYPVIYYNTVNAKELWHTICESAHSSAEPGLFFIDRCNKLSNSHYFNKLTASNPCAEQPLPDFGLCMLGHIHLAKFARKENKFPANEVTKYTGTLAQWLNIEDLRCTIRNAVEFLDNSLDHSFQPLDEVIARVKQERRIGLGTLGLGELLITLGFRYGSEASVSFCSELYEFIMYVAYHASEELANIKGSFSAFNVDGYLASGFVKSNPYIQDIRNMRNVCLLTQAPTGSVGTMVGTSTGIEPYYSFTWERTSNLGKNVEIASVVNEYANRHGISPTGLNLPTYFVNAMDGSVTVDGHIAIQAVVQKYTCSAVSKTINVPESYTVDQIKEAYMKLYTSGCKGGTVYRDNSRNEQVLRTVEPKKEEPKPEPKPEIKKRPRVRDAKMISVNTSMGTAHVTLTFDDDHVPLEVFVEVGKGGSDVKAFSEAFGRLISLLLRIPSTSSPQERLEEVIRQLKDIGGARPLGFGKNKSKSLPDSIAKALNELSQLLNEEVLTEEPHSDIVSDKPIVNADLCPSCGDVTLIQTEGCCSCLNCGHSEC